MDYHSFLKTQKEQQINKECLLEGTCSPTPIIAFSHELIISYLQELSFYLLKLNELGIKNQTIKDNIMNVISGIILNIEYEQPQLFETINKIYANLQEAKELYISVCKRNDLKKFIIKSKLKDPQALAFSDAIATGQRIFKSKYEKLTSDQLNILDIIMNISKSLAIHMIELNNLGEDDAEVYEAILHLLNYGKFHEDFEARAIKMLNKFAMLDHKLFMKLWELKENRYGKLNSVNISFATRPNKAILVSGGDLKDLEMVLEATKDKGIDVYTHGKLLYAHGYPFFQKYPHLVGHYGHDIDSFLVDFAEFPGAIFVTRNSFRNVQSLYRSNIYTTNVIVPKGVARIKNYNFEPLIDAALRAKGFRNGRKESFLKININEAHMLARINAEMEKLEKNQINNIIVLGISNHSKPQKDYFNTFLNLLDDKSFVLSFSYSNKKQNVVLVESEFGLPMLFGHMSNIAEKTDLSKYNITIMFAKMESYTLSTIIYLKSVGLRNIYMENSYENRINPSVIETFRRIFKIKNYTTPENDLNYISNSKTEDAE